MKPKEAPVFVSLPEPVTVEEGEWARFCVRVTGHPRPRVMWLINGHTVVNVSPDLSCVMKRKYVKIKINALTQQGSRYKLTYDGMYHMDIPKTRQYDTGKIEVIARNSIGEALATTELSVIPRKDDYRGVLKNAPRREYLPSLYLTKNTNQIHKSTHTHLNTLIASLQIPHNVDFSSQLSLDVGNFSLHITFQTAM